MSHLKFKQVFIAVIFLVLPTIFIIYSPVFAWYPVCVNCKEGPSSSGRDWEPYTPEPKPVVPQAPTKPQETEEQRKKRQAIEINTQCVELHNKGELDNAIYCYQQALKLDPYNLVIQESLNFARMMKSYYYGVYYYNQKDWKKAAEYFEEALSHKYDDNIREYLRLSKHMLSEMEIEERWKRERETREMEFSEAKEKMRQMLDDLKVDFDRRENQPPSELKFIEPEGPLFTKGDKNSAPVAVPTNLLRPGSGPDVAGQETSAEIKQLEKEYWDLDEKIRNEKDPIKRAELINRQTYIRSLMGVLEIQLMDKFKEKKKKAEDENKEMKIKACLAIAASSTLLGNLDDALKMLKDAQAEVPNDKGIQRALNYVNYIKDIAEEKVSFNPQWPLLVDAISYGQGDWEVSISYLKKASNEYPEDKNICTALKYIEGMRAEESVEELFKGPTSEDILRLFPEVASAVGEDKFEDAQSLIKQAKRPDIPVPYLDDLANLIEELFVSVSKKAERQERWPQVHALTCKSLQAQMRNDIESAFRYIKEAHELDPGDMGVRDAFNYMQGIYDATQMRKKEK